ncbi:hypothetical protein DFH09DRAFT_1357199 [Mycena vulgaris]|nr:hypothetical protein DFH09DRAFT_1357199 [Mycena vulgaris]
MSHVPARLTPIIRSWFDPESNAIPDYASPNLYPPRAVPQRQARHPTAGIISGPRHGIVGRRQLARLGFDGLGRFTDPSSSQFYAPTVGGVIVILVQLFFCWRMLPVRHVWSLLIVATSLAQFAIFASGRSGGILSYITPDPTKQEASVHLSIIVDVLVAATAISFLLRPSLRAIVEHSLFNEPDTLSAAIVRLVLLLGMPGNTHFILPTMVLPGIYANTLFAAVNGRRPPPPKAKAEAEAWDEEDTGLRRREIVWRILLNVTGITLSNADITLLITRYECTGPSHMKDALEDAKLRTGNRVTIADIVKELRP